MLITSRSFAEYEAMFDLATEDLSGGVVDVCAGGSSFVAECAARGVPAIALDPAYASGTEALRDAVSRAITDGHALIADHADRFVWDRYRNLNEHRAIRELAARTFLSDVAEHPSRYVAGELPVLPLRSGIADLVVCSHLLFTWSDRFDVDWHHAAISELARVSRRQVRVFPLVSAGAGDAVPFLPHLVDRLREDGMRVSMRRVPYEFQVGANEMLVVSR